MSDRTLAIEISVLLFVLFEIIFLDLKSKRHDVEGRR
jgi:hypothetical protein